VSSSTAGDHSSARVCVLEGHDFGEWQAGFVTGQRPSRLPYGMEWLSNAGFDLRHSDLTHSSRGLARLLRFKDPVLPYGLRFNGALGQAAVALPLLARSDVCLSIFEHHAAVYAYLRSLRPLRLPPMVLVSCYLAEWLRSRDETERRLAHRAAGAAAAITVYSANQVDIVHAAAGVPIERLHVVPYGVDSHFYRPPTQSWRGQFVGAVGRDSGRDWRTFLRAAATTPEIPFKLATPRHMLDGLDIPPNVEHVGEVDHLGYRRLLTEAALIVVPTHDFNYPTGQSVMLEAMASGAPVVVPNTRAMSDYVTSAARTYAVGDAQDLSRRVRELWHDPAQRNIMGRNARVVARQRFDTLVMWRQIGAVIASVVESCQRLV
jgi:glycosyltransferase involved in cell wall biosynthesis